MSAVQLELEKFNWVPQPAAGRFVSGLIQRFLAACPAAATLSYRMLNETGTRFVDWVDYIQVHKTAVIEARLAEVGFSRRPQPGAEDCFVHEGAIFPTILLSDTDPGLHIGLKVDSVSDFLSAHNSDVAIEGEPHSQFRRACAFTSASGAKLWAIERHGYRGFVVAGANPAKEQAAQRHLESLRKRRRDFTNDDDGFVHLNALVDAAISDLGSDWTCDLFFEAERRYWQRRNHVARFQKTRQDQLGLGWANHDHHTYRASRPHFKSLIALQEKLGFKPRERFYAGAEAGWGAQVLEHHATGITTFNDVDMSPEELMGDFAHQGLEDRAGEPLGTVGIWCALHGEAILQAGMHHLECVFDWHLLKTQMADEGSIRTMDPFTTFSYLRQAFTEGERWIVPTRRIDALLAEGRIDWHQAEQFRLHGAIGSHLENLERNDGFKGFNQQGVSDIISRTDPRRVVRMS